MTRQLTILVVDDSAQARLMTSGFVKRMGHVALLARNGAEAVEVFTTHAPDLILMDCHMPEMDGHEAVRRIRQLSGNTWIPIVFLSADVEEVAFLRGLEVGGDDYLTKPVHFRLLEAKIKALQRVVGMQRQLQEHVEQLAHYRDENEREQRLARHLMEQLVYSHNLEDNAVQRWVMPAQHFSGDLLATARTPSGILHVMLADGTGHGLAAALSVMPVAEAFYGMTRKGFTIANIVCELNRKLKHLLPTGRFVAATLASINPGERTVEVWNGGNPPAYFVDQNGNISHRWPAVHPALGLLSTREFDERTEVFQWNAFGQLYVCSDGVLEAENPTGEAFGVERIEEIFVKSSPESRFTRLRTAVCGHLAGQDAHDDVSMVAIDCLVVSNHHILGGTPPS